MQFFIEMRFFMKRLFKTAGAVLVISAGILVAQYQSRSLLAKDLYYIENGKVETCKYWSLPLGRFQVKITQYFPGEGNVSFNAEMNYALLSSGYIEGSGYGDRGKAAANGMYAVQSGDTLRPIEFSEIDYVYMNGSKVKLSSLQEPVPLFIKSEGNKLQSRSISLMVWRMDEVYKELKHDKDIERIIGFAFTRENALKALKVHTEEVAAMQ